MEIRFVYLLTVCERVLSFVTANGPSTIPNSPSETKLLAYVIGLIISHH